MRHEAAPVALDGSARRMRRVVGLAFPASVQAETGVPLRRYRLWNRTGAAVPSPSREGQFTTEAAHAAFFASSAHFSTAFRDMFGMMPSELLKGLEPAQRPGVLSSSSKELTHFFLPAPKRKVGGNSPLNSLRFNVLKPTTAKNPDPPANSDRQLLYSQAQRCALSFDRGPTSSSNSPNGINLWIFFPDVSHSTN